MKNENDNSNRIICAACIPKVPSEKRTVEACNPYGRTSSRLSKKPGRINQVAVEPKLSSYQSSLPKPTMPLGS